jgi:hypothetical protein
MDVCACGRFEGAQSGDAEEEKECGGEEVHGVGGVMGE